jgi:hypothetical protein
MKRSRTARLWIGILPLVVCALGGCVERTAKVETRPAGALVIVNDEEVGVSPVKFAFTWYGDYDIILRKPGYETVKTHYRMDAPWYEWSPIDIVTETLIPVMFSDQHTLPPFDLQPTQTPTVEEVVQRATEMRDQALYEGE